MDVLNSSYLLVDRSTVFSKCSRYFAGIKVNKSTGKSTPLFSASRFLASVLANDALAEAWTVILKDEYNIGVIAEPVPTKPAVSLPKRQTAHIQLMRDCLRPESIGQERRWRMI